MTVIKLTPQESKAHACYFHKELPASFYIVRKTLPSVALCSICYRR